MPRNPDFGEPISSGSWGKRLQEIGQRAPAIIFTGAMVSAWLAIGVVAWFSVGVKGLLVGAIAFFACYLSGLLGMAVGWLLKSRMNAAQAMMATLVLRMGLPLAAFLALFYRAEELLAAGLVPIFVAFYVLMLAVETWLVVVALDDDRG